MSTSGPSVPAEPDPVRRLLQRSLRELLWATAAIGLLGAVLGLVLDGTAGLYGALLGVGVGLLFCGTTVVSMLVSVHKPVSVLAGVVLGAWVVKMIVVVAVLAVIRDLEFYDKYVFAAVLVLLVLTSTAIDVRAVLQGRVPHGNARPESGQA